MIGLVIVSHSQKIGEGARELAAQMTQDTLRIAVAAGIDDPDNPIGTDTMRVMEAIQSVYSDEGVIVLMDLGSAILSTETAIDLLDPSWRDNIFLSAAPLIEGVVAAAVQTSIGLPMKKVIAEADNALHSKRLHLARSAYDLADDTYAQPRQSWTDQARELQLIVPNKQGLHARAAARIVQIASRYQAKLFIRKNGNIANADSINQIAVLDARQGDQVTFLADGVDAAALLHAIQGFADNNFGDPLIDTSRQGLIAQAQENHPNHVVTGIPASKGVALGEVYTIDTALPDISPYKIKDIRAEKTYLQAAIEAVVQELQQLVETSKNRLGVNESSIFDAQILILRDPELHQLVDKRITQEQLNAASVWWTAIEQVATRYQNLEDPYLRERAADVRDVGRRVLRRLSPEVMEVTQQVPIHPCIIVASELSASDIAQFDEDIVMGIVTEKGGSTSHSAIIARALGVPAIVGVGSALYAIHAGQTIAIDGEKGWLWTQLNAHDQQELEVAREHWTMVRNRMRQVSRERAFTLDGEYIEIAANIGTPTDAFKAAEMGAEGVGLFRTEYLFIDSEFAPSENEQFNAYCEAAEFFEGFPVVIRTLDVGGDKLIKYLYFDFEANPFLGHRGIRYWLDAPDIAKKQLRAIYRASAYHNFHIMLPMVSTVAELTLAKQMMVKVQAELDTAGIPYNPSTPIGIMIEVPSTILIADQLARQVDFFSIGTNDLVQYIMAADRGNARVNKLVDYYQPSVLNAIRQVIESAHRANIGVSVCGEMAADSLAAVLLIGMGIDKLSMNAHSIPEIKAMIRNLSMADMRLIAAQVMQLESAETVRRHLQNVLA